MHRGNPNVQANTDGLVPQSIVTSMYTVSNLFEPHPLALGYRIYRPLAVCDTHLTMTMTRERREGRVQSRRTDGVGGCGGRGFALFRSHVEESTKSQLTMMFGVQTRVSRSAHVHHQTRPVPIAK